MNDREPSTHGRPGAALRLIFAYEGDDVTLLSRRRVEMTLPPADKIDRGPDVQGFWTELRRDDGELLETRVVENPIRRDTEVFSEDPDRSVTRTPVERPQGAFTIVVPDYPEADHVILVAGGPEVAAPGAEAVGASRRREIARVLLRPPKGKEDA